MNSTNSKSHSQGTIIPQEISALKFSTLLLSVTFLMFSVLLYLPAAIYLSNLNEFSLRLNDLSWIFLPAWVLSVTCGVGLVLLLPRAARSHVVSLTFALGLLLWLQGGVLVWQYGPLDGSDIPWESYWQYGIRGID